MIRSRSLHPTRASMSIRCFALAVVLSLSPVACTKAQESAGPPTQLKARLPVLNHFQSSRPVSTNRTAPAREAVAADRDLTSEKIAIAVVVVIIAVVLIRTLK